MADLRLACPCRVIITGASMVGKTYFLTQLLEAGEKCFTEKFSDIYWCSSLLREHEMETLKKKFGNIKFIQGFPEETILNGSLVPKDQNACLVIDDLGHEIEKSKALKYLFSIMSHHEKINVFLLLQALYWPGESIRIANRNASQLIMFKSPRDNLAVRMLSKQIFVNQSSSMIDAYKCATEAERGYLLIDLSPTTKDRHRLRTNILPEQNNMTVFVPKND